MRLLENPRGYLYRTAMNGYRSAYRRVLRAASTRLLPQPRDELAPVEARSVALQALAQLTPRQRVALVLTEVLGFPTKDAGELMGVAPGAVRTLLSRAKARLAAMPGPDHE